MIKEITNKLTLRPSYTRWGNNKLASHFGCSPKTMKKILLSLKDVRKNYNQSLKTNSN